VATAASGILTFGANSADGKVVAIGTRQYTLQDTLTDVNGNVKIGDTASETLDNLIAAINHSTRQVVASGVLDLSGGNALDTLAAAVGVLSLSGNARDDAATGVFTLGGNILDAVKATGVLTLTGTAKAAVKATGTLTVNLIPVTAAKAQGTFTLTGNATDGKVVVIGTGGSAKTYTFQDTLTDAPNNIKIAAAAADTLDHLMQAIMGGPGAGTHYGTGTTPHATVVAYPGDGDTMVAEAKVAGTAGNAIATTTDVTLGSWGGQAHLNGGTDNETVQIGTRTYTFVTAVSVADDVKIGATPSDTIDNLVAAITYGGGVGTGEGSLFGTGTTVHPTVTAVRDEATMVATAKTAGVAGNSIATLETLANGSWVDVTLLLGVDLETVVIGTRTYTFKAAVAVADDVKIEVAAGDTIDNLIAAITAGTGAGDKYGTGTAQHAVVTALAGDGDTMDVTAKVAGVAGNVVVVANMTMGTWGHDHLQDGKDLETVRIDNRTYTFETSLVNSANNVKIGDTAADTIDNLVAAITAGNGGGTKYGTGTAVHATVTAVRDGNTMVATAKSTGVAGNSIALVESTDNGSWGGQATLLGGVDSEYIEISAMRYTFKRTLVGAYDVKIGVSASATIDNLVAAITDGGGEGSLYGTGTAAHPTVTAEAGDGDTMNVTALTAGSAGNLIPLVKVMANGTWDGGYLQYGDDAESVTIDGQVYTFQGTLTDVDGNVLIGDNTDMSIGNLISAINLGGAAICATGTLTFGENAVNGNTVTLGDVTYVIDETLSDVANHVLLGGDADETIRNLALAIMVDDEGNSEGVRYGTGTVANPLATAQAAHNVLNAVSVARGLNGNAVLTDATLENGSWGDSNLTGGRDRYAASTVVHPTVTAANGDGDTIVVTAKTIGLAGNAIAVAEDLTNGSWDDDFLTGGKDLYALVMTIHPLVSADVGEADTMIATAKTVGLAGNAIGVNTNVGSAGWDDDYLTGGAEDDGIMIVGHDLESGDGPFVVSTSMGGTLPSGLVAGAFYWTYAADVDHLTLHLCKADAQVGRNAVDITSAGTGTQTLTPATSGQAVVELLRQGKSPMAISKADDIDDLI
jgi:hypothetical protein